jgi:predicted type IV restriction endonuclease
MTKIANEINRMELISEDIFLSDDLDESNPVDVFTEGNDTDENPIRIYTLDKNENIRVFKLKKQQSVIEVEHRGEILDYCLSKVTAADEVGLIDIFIHGKYVEEIIK